ncbi:galactokinase [Corynebacterium pseudotuberculosis]|uniref:galactokinase n=1 Tax=Corynebacterium pseudotuberculosis TaxID=1719 RepID=UPI000232467C|nr:galactokinase [Corynebacterium pseudotuberculosis]AER68872.1 Galactokinase [Corynebacterium pseudotuberculosis 1/06-A]AKS13156.1 Galactokinase [Corynebacterium pseudotuberculosis]AMN69826.1 galactokinase [Corynebacterium pseudotuberculosis]AMN73094.1 galactokinase [Corynebacterium pseudotuberculosis]AMN75908.1 galactokinase [Corynebacterium pseudotuberculosis]
MLELRWVHTRSPEHIAQDAAQLFRAHYHYDPAGVWGAPGRVNVIGDHVDYAGGISIPFALEQLTAVAMSPNNSGMFNLVSQTPEGETLTKTVNVDLVGPLSPSDWSGYVVGAIWAGTESGVIEKTQGYDIAIVSDVPLGSGLSSSAALECSSAVGAFELANGQPPSREKLPQLVDACVRAENDVVGASTGGLDQRSSLFGEQGKALVIDFSSGKTTPVPFDLTSKGLALLIVNTNAPHTLSDGQYASRRGLVDDVTAVLGDDAKTLRDINDAPARARQWAENNNLNAEEVYRRVNHVVEETLRAQQAAVALEKDDIDTFRRLMQESHESLRDQYEVVTPELESAFQAAGCYGSRMTGGGFGGSVISLVDATAITETAEKIAKAACDHGFPSPTFLIARPGEGARRLL